MVSKVQGFTTKNIPLTGLFIIIIIFIILPACGRKAPPQLKVFDRPAKAENLRIIHNERGLTLSWSYPERNKSSIRGFIILRSDNGDFKKKGYIEMGRDFYFVDRGFGTDRTYRYRVITEGVNGLMSEAVEIKATPIKLPEPPKNIRFAIKNDSIKLSWEKDGVCYKIYRAFVEGDYSALNEKPICAEYFIDSTHPERPAHYIIRSVVLTDIVNEGTSSEEIIVRLEDYIPSPPSDLRTIVGNGKIYLLWKESPEVWVKGYRVYRKVEGEKEFKLIGENDIPAFTDTAMSGLEGKKLTYMVKALGPVRESEPTYSYGSGFGVRDSE